MISMSMAAHTNEGDNSYQQDHLLVSKYQMNDEDMRLSQNIDYMREIIDERNQNINQIGDIMANINEMAKDLAIETK